MNDNDDQPVSKNQEDKKNLNASDSSGAVDPMVRDGVNNVVLAAYSVGHFANDLCASMWFIYLSYYLLNVVQLPASISGLCLLSG